MLQIGPVEAARCGSDGCSAKGLRCDTNHTHRRFTCVRARIISQLATGGTCPVLFPFVVFQQVVNASHCHCSKSDITKVKQGVLVYEYFGVILSVFETCVSVAFEKVRLLKV